MVKFLGKLKENVLSPLRGDPIVELPVERRVAEDLSRISLAIYTVDDTSDLPRDWHYWFTYKSDTSDPRQDSLGFMGSFVYRLIDGKIKAWAIVFRGTVPTDIYDIIGAIEISFNKIPLQMVRASQYVKQEIDRIKTWHNKDVAESFEKVPVYITGHSLGAVIASNIFASMEKPGGRIQCITFDNPGSLEIARKYLQSQGQSEDLAYVIVNGLKSWVHNIQADVNIINTWNEQWGDVYRIMRYYTYGYSSPKPPTIIPQHINLYYVSIYSIDNQHNMGKIDYSITTGDTTIIKDSSPFGSFGGAGYYAYLDVGKRQEYWREYAATCWMYNVDNINRRFNDLDQFRQYLFSQLHRLSNLQTAPTYLQTSSAYSAKPNAIFSWLSDTISSCADYGGTLMNKAMDNMIDLITSHAQEVVQECPSYFPKDNQNYWRNNTPSLMFYNSPHAENSVMLPAPSQLKLGR